MGSGPNRRLIVQRSLVYSSKLGEHSMSDATGKLIAGKYELVTHAGDGGMAVVWKAVVRGPGAFQKSVAIKRIQSAKHADPSFIKMFEEEARVGSQLQHPNIVGILDFGRDDTGGYYLVMEWVEGLDMFQWVKAHQRAGRATPWALTAATGIEVLRGLAAAHDRHTEEGVPAPVIHRDVSPSNILLGANGTVKLSDFGLARAMDRPSMTRANVIKGKLAYCAPELITGAKANPRTDIFALGVVLWEALAQRRLFTGKNDLEILLAVRKGDVPALDAERPEIPPAMHAVILQALAPNPEERFQNATEMARALASVLRSTTEQTDAGPLGASVRFGREQLGIKTVTSTGETSSPKQKLVGEALPSIELDFRSPSEMPPRSIEELSVSDVEVETDVNVPRGVFEADDRSTALPLTTKKK